VPQALGRKAFARARDLAGLSTLVSTVVEGDWQVSDD
jgi:hypothetical protein